MSARPRLVNDAASGLARSGYASAATILALAYVLAGAACLLLAAMPLGAGAPIGLEAVAGGLEIAIGAALAVGRRRMGVRLLHLAVVVRLAVAGLLTAWAATTAGITLLGFSSICVVVFAAYFFRRSTARIYIGLAVASYAVTALVWGPGGPVLLPVVVAVGIIAAGEIVGHMVAQLRAAASSDPLTGLVNRASFRSTALREIAMAARGHESLSLVLLDLDDFKSVNDIHGHSAGDALLVELAGQWQRQLRSTDVLARYGGDEFALLLPHTALTDTDRILDRLRAAHPTPWSAGVTSWVPGTDLERMLEIADQALYRAKNQRVLGDSASSQLPKSAASIGRAK